MLNFDHKHQEKSRLTGGLTQLFQDILVLYYLSLWAAWWPHG